MRILYLLILTAPFLLFAEDSWTQELPGGFRASVHVPKTRISIDEELILHLALEYPSTHLPDLDTIRMNLLKYVGVTEPPFALIGEKVEEAGKGAMKITFRMEPQLAKIHFVSFYDIPFVPLEKGPTKKIISEIFEIDVFLPKIDPAYHGHAIGLLSLTEPLPIGMDIKNTQRIEHPDRIQEEAKRSVSIVSSRSIPWTQMMGVLLFCIIVFIARMQPKKIPDPKKTIQKQAASAKLKALDTIRTLDSAEKERFYINLTNTVRTFIEEKYQIKATSQTTQEFLHAMANHPSFDNETQAMLSDFLISSDRVKFADQKPSEDDCNKALQTAEQFISKYTEMNSKPGL